MNGLQEKIDNLLRYRNSMNESERELFDLLMSYAKEVASTVEPVVSC